jgi:hypothetical protein
MRPPGAWTIGTAAAALPALALIALGLAAPARAQAPAPVAPPAEEQATEQQ